MNTDKQTILTLITHAATTQLITRDELLTAYERGQTEKAEENLLTKHMGLAEMLYFIGGFIVVVGIGVLIGQNWSTLSSFTKILSTLGFGIMAYIVGVILNKEEKYGAVGYAFHLIAALVIPLGLGVVFNEAGFDAMTSGMQSVIASALVAMYLASYLVFQKPVFTFFAIAYGTWLFFSFTNFLIGPNPVFYDAHFYEYRFLLTGVSYVFLGYYFSTTVQKALTGALYAFGSFFVLGSTLALGGWKPEQNVLWELLFPGIVFLILYMSVKLKNKSFLTFGTLFLMLYILKITGEYFSGTLGWPIFLIICGISLIGIGYYAFTLNKKYISLS